jgi:NAD(P) transhydrogenase subunit alpha
MAIVGVPKETSPGERRVALVPASVPPLVKQGLEVWIERDAGDAAGFPDRFYTAAGAKLATRDELYANAAIVVQVAGHGVHPATAEADLPRLRDGQAVIAFQEALSNPRAAKALADRGVRAFAMELMPRITRAQSMDALSSMATIAGYKAVLIAAGAMPKLLPMLTTAAGSYPPARAFIIGAGVAGLQAIATAKRLGAVVSAYDVRPAAREQVESVGARFVELPLDTGQAEDKGGYAKALGEEFYKRQRELLAKVVAESDLVITTAAVPGKKAPVLVTREMVAGMTPGSVIVDLAAERGGNCEVTRGGETIVLEGVTVLGPLNLPSTVPAQSSQMYARNVVTFLQHLCPQGALRADLDTDEIARETLVTRDGAVVHARVRDGLGS